MAEDSIAPLSDREMAILRTLIYDFIDEGKPVGSRHLMQKYQFNLSSATIRNVMSDLEQRGFITQPHSSAGRIPTDKAYRFYFDEIVKIYDDALSERKKLEELFFTKKMELDALLEYSSKILAGMSQMTGMVLGPRSDQMVIKQVEMINLGEGEILVLFVSRSKMVINRRIKLQEYISSEELDIINRFLNDSIVGYGIYEFKERLLHSISKLHDDLSGLRDKALALASLAIEPTHEDTYDGNLYIEGVKHLVNRQEDFSSKKLQDVMEVIEEKETLKKILSRNIQSNGIQALIGHEIDIQEIAGCSIITSTYKMGNRNMGILGIIGPTRMQYEKMVPLIDNLSKSITELLNKLSQ